MFGSESDIETGSCIRGEGYSQWHPTLTVTVTIAHSLYNIIIIYLIKINNYIIGSRSF